MFKRKLRAVGSRVKWKALAGIYRLPEVQIDSVASVKRSELEDLIADDCCMPPLPGLPHDDIGAVLRIARSRRAGLICEIGTAHGNLSTNLLRNCPQARLITINAPAELQTGGLVTYELSKEEIGRVYRNNGLENRVVQVFVNSLNLDLSRYTGRNTLDLAIIDGCHDLNFVINDFEKVRDYVREGGEVLFHDTHPSQIGHLASSYRACLLLRRTGFDVRWIRDTWWGYWKKPAGAARN